MKMIVLMLFVILPSIGFAQNVEDIKKFDSLFVTNIHQHNWRGQLKGNRNELTFVFSSFFVIYKEMFSSQDVDACVFTPSCSVYAIESIKRKGFFVGFLSAIDRLTRCNPGRNKNLPINPITHKFSDPLD